MRNQWGNDDHGPGGDPSWLGGGGRPDGENRAGEWSSDFSADAAPRSAPNAADSDFGGAQPEQAPEYSGPRFGDRIGQDPGSEDQAQGSSWLSSFSGQAASGGRNGSRSGRPSGKRLAGWATSAIGLVIFVVIASRFGMNMWWVFLVFGLPMLSRLFRR